MASDNPLRPPVVLLPWAGTWAKVIADAIEVGFSNAERNEPVIGAALEGLDARTPERVMSGETALPAHWDRVIGHLVVLLRHPCWMPFSHESSEKVKELLQDWLQKLELLSARSSMSPNIDAAVTRAAVRLVVIEAALCLGCVARCWGTAPVEFRPLKPKEGLGRVVRDLSRRFNPPLKRQDIAEKLRLSLSVWDRLLQGEIPKTAGFEFDVFARLWGGPSEQQVALAFSLRRAFVACRLCAQLRETVQVGEVGSRFWAENWDEFERIYQLASATKASVGGVLDFAHARVAAANSARGIWAHAFRAGGDWLAHLETVANAASEVTSRESATGIRLTDEVILALLDRYAEFQPARIVERARLVAGTPEALRLLHQLPRTSGNILSLGREYMVQGNHAAARQHFEEAYRLSPDDWTAISDLAWFEARFGDPARTLALLTADRWASQREHPLVRGEALWRLGRFDEALRLFQESVSRRHALAHSYGRAAQCCLQLGRDGEAKAYAKSCQRFTDQDPLSGL